VNATSPVAADFQALLNQVFRLWIGTDAVAELVLTECTEPQRNGDFSSFSVTFRGGPEAPQQQGTYLLSSDGFDETAIFLVPVQRVAEGLEYHAVFSRLLEEASE